MFFNACYANGSGWQIPKTGAKRQMRIHVENAPLSTFSKKSL